MVQKYQLTHFANRNIKALIIDEADRILEVGFEDEVISSYHLFATGPFRTSVSGVGCCQATETQDRRRGTVLFEIVLLRLSPTLLLSLTPCCV